MKTRPHPYQLISSPRSTAFRCFEGLLVPEKRRQWCFPLHCLRPLVSYCESTCGSSAYCVRPLEIAFTLRHTENKAVLQPRCSGQIACHSGPQNTSEPHPKFESLKAIKSFSMRPKADALDTPLRRERLSSGVTMLKSARLQPIPRILWQPAGRPASSTMAENPE